MEWTNLDNELKVIGEEMVVLLQDALNNIGQGQSDLYSNIKYTINNKIVAISMPQYGYYLDEGTKPHMPRVDSIRPWAEARGLNAWAVAINIKKYGTRPQPFLFALDKTTKEIDPRIADAGFKDVVIESDRLIQSAFKNSKIQ
jgi:hypothetical protein